MSIFAQTRGLFSMLEKALESVMQSEVIIIEMNFGRGLSVRPLGYKHTDEWKSAQREWVTGNKSRTGQTRSNEERKRASVALSGRIQTKIECPHCGKIGGNAMRRWHFENCKAKS